MAFWYAGYRCWLSSLSLKASRHWKGEVEERPGEANGLDGEEGGRVTEEREQEVSSGGTIRKMRECMKTK